MATFAGLALYYLWRRRRVVAMTLDGVRPAWARFDAPASASLIENWLDETERRTWFLFEAGREARTSGH